MKLCCDGVYRSSREGFVVCTLGVLVKSEDPPTKLQYGADRGFSTSFLELLVAICASESKAWHRTGSFSKLSGELSILYARRLGSKREKHVA